MRLYIAGLYTSHFSKHGNLYRRATPNTRLLRDQVSHYLESYHYIHKGNYVKNIRREENKIFLDSGAFSAFSLGVTINIDEYAEFVLAHQDIIEIASVLDDIGNPEGTYANQKYLEKRGCEVLPCFHFGEPLDLCRFYAENYEYMTIGGMVPIPNSKLGPWLDEVWDKALTDKDGYAKLKVHGFGLTTRSLMLRYPWYSVDSSAWVQAALNGGVVFPEIPRTIPISAQSPATKTFGAHFNTLPEISQKYVLDLLEYYGLSLNEVQNDYKARWALNAFSYDRLGKLLGDDHWKRPFKATQGTLF